MPAPANLVHQTSTTTGTGALTLAAVNGKQTFLAAFGTGGTDTFDYFISNQSAAEWERGTGHENAGTLVRDTVIESTNANAAVNFSAGTKDIINDIPAGSQLNLSTTQTANRIFAGPASGAAAAPTFRALVALDLASGGSSSNFLRGDMTFQSVPVPAAASQAEEEAASSTTVYTSPGTQKYHPGCAKAWAFATVSGGTPTLQTSYNVTSITDTATGQLTVTIATDFSSANWSCQVTTQISGLTTSTPTYNNIATGSVVCCATNASAFADPVSWSFAGWGDQ